MKAVFSGRPLVRERINWVGIVGLCLLMIGCHGLKGATGETNVSLNGIEDSINHSDGNPALPSGDHGDVAGKVARTRILVKFKKDLDPKEQSAILERYGLTQFDEIESIGVKILEIPSDKTSQEIIGQLRMQEKESIEYVEADSVVSIPEPIDDARAE